MPEAFNDAFTAMFGSFVSEVQTIMMTEREAGVPFDQSCVHSIQIQVHDVLHTVLEGAQQQLLLRQRQASPPLERPKTAPRRDHSPTKAARRDHSPKHQMDSDELNTLEMAIARKIYQSSRALNKVFASYDALGTGSLTPPEFEAALAKLGLIIEDADLRKIISRYDVAGTGTISYAHFCQRIESARTQPATSNQVSYSASNASLERSRRANDPNLNEMAQGNVQVPRKLKLARLASQIRTRLNAHFNGMRDIFLFLDRNGQGRVHLSEFQLALTSIGMDISTADLHEILVPFAPSSQRLARLGVRSDASTQDQDSVVLTHTQVLPPTPPPTTAPTTTTPTPPPPCPFPHQRSAPLPKLRPSAPASCPLIRCYIASHSMLYSLSFDVI
jgi:Ca2+-binding EF-hand superfamily protein